MSFSDKLKIKPDFFFIQELRCVTSLHNGEQVDKNKAGWDGSLTTALRTWAAVMSQRQGAAALMHTLPRDWCCHSSDHVLDCICGEHLVLLYRFGWMTVGAGVLYGYWVSVNGSCEFMTPWQFGHLIMPLRNKPASAGSRALFSENISEQAADNTSSQLWVRPAGVMWALW